MVRTPARAVEFEMDQPPFARGHGIEAKGCAGFAHALRGHARRKLQFVEARRRDNLRSRTGRDRANADRAAASGARYIRARAEVRRCARAAELLIVAAKGDDHVRLVASASALRRRDFALERKIRLAHRAIEKTLQLAGSRARDRGAAARRWRARIAAGPFPRRCCALSLILFSS